MIRPLAFAVATLALAASAATAQTVTLKELFARPEDPARRIASGETKRAALTPNDLRLSDSTHAAVWYFTGKSGQRVRITQRSDAFDSFLTLGRAGAEEPLAQNDDAEDLHSEIATTLPEDGLYVIVANTYGQSVGDYTLALEIREPAPGLSGPQTPLTAMLREAEATRRLGLNQRFGSQLDARDAKLDDSTHYELWHVNGTAGDTLTLVLEATQFDGALHIGAQGGTALLGSARMPGRAALRVILPQTGTYSIVVQATTPGAVGSYILDLQRNTPPQP